MWKNVFVEACILSLLVFGGFYLHATFMKEKISASEEKVWDQQARPPAPPHISGSISQPVSSGKKSQHISGTESDPGDKATPSPGGKPQEIHVR